MSNKRDLCLVHIGMPKTGSSTLQEAFFNGFEDERVSYANLPHPNQSGWLNGLFCENPEQYHFFIKKGIDTPEKVSRFRHETKEMLIEGFLSHKSSVEVMSGEDLYHLDERSIKKLKKFLEPYFHEILVVAYVRPVYSFMASAFQQLVKYHDQASFDHNLVYHKYRNFERYDRVFGVERVKLFKFEPSLFPGGDIVKDFCDRLGFSVNESKADVVNESLSKEAISVLFTYNFHSGAKTDFRKEQHYVHNRLVELISTIGNQKFQFSRKYIQSTLLAFESDYEWIKARMNDSLDEPLEANYDNGVSSEGELMRFSTKSIPALVSLLGNYVIPFELKNDPQTVARLVNILAGQIYETLRTREAC
ncbi:hypothetical protein HNO52_02075 [Billgrantia diversa]|uniref:hypothetical protein n=1 Tax=Halomonas sp. MCCC 1A13316 TaxID=2733487 RepID=UPI0018A62F3C|nr:hypothetical protein [Halomonas sp. MCCC 1A13316]QOR37433.1 hypothetical protein HNO52_02075 [Halomonas sp. MCCC 1A13316]